MASIKDNTIKPPPNNYICHRCGVSGHWVNNCPNLNHTSRRCNLGIKCPHVRRGNCKFSHPPCKNGFNCRLLKQQQCGFFHPKSHFVNQRKQNAPQTTPYRSLSAKSQIGGRNESKMANTKCRYGLRCSKFSQGKCSFSHPNPHLAQTSKKRSSRDLACAFMTKGCTGNLCQDKYGHPKFAKDRGNYYCQFGDRCRFMVNMGKCQYKHVSITGEWEKGSAPKEYACQFHALTTQGCGSSADECWMYHSPNIKHEKLDTKKNDSQIIELKQQLNEAKIKQEKREQMIKQQANLLLGKQQQILKQQQQEYEEKLKREKRLKLKQKQRVQMLKQQANLLLGQQQQEYEEKLEQEQRQKLEHEQQQQKLKKQVLKYNKENKKLKKQMHQGMKVVNIWQWQDDNGMFNHYDKDTSDAIDKLSKSQSVIFRYKFNGNVHTSKIIKQSSTTAKQINILTKKRRNVQMVQKLIPRRIEQVIYPKWWDKKYIDASRYVKPVLIELNLNASPGVDVVNDFHLCCPNRTVVKVESVQNQMLYDRYWNARKRLIKSLGRNNLNEFFLYHGTKKIDVMKEVYTQGFRKEFNSTSRWGEGTYLATDASYSANGYCGFDNNTGAYQMFQCKVITGERYKGSGSYKLKLWPKKSNGLIYDSLVDNTSNPSIFVIHENERAYPMFIIHFK